MSIIFPASTTTATDANLHFGTARLPAGSEYGGASSSAGSSASSDLIASGEAAMPTIPASVAGSFTAATGSDASVNASRTWMQWISSSPWIKYSLMYVAAVYISLIVYQIVAPAKKTRVEALKSAIERDDDRASAPPPPTSLAAARSAAAGGRYLVAAVTDPFAHAFDHVAQGFRLVHYLAFRFIAWLCNCAIYQTRALLHR